MKNFICALVLCFIAGTVFARPIKPSNELFGKPLHATVLITQPAATRGTAFLLNSRAPVPAAPKRYKDIYLMNMPLTATQKRQFTTMLPAMDSATTTPDMSPSLPDNVALGMNNVPVLDQGEHGTCATFAVTAALDALLSNSSDSNISPLCSLALGEYMASNSYLPSGWNGSYTSLILQRYLEFGVVSIDDQQFKSCGGLKDYPLPELVTSSAMTIDQYYALSDNISANIHWYPLMSIEERMSWGWGANAVLGTQKLLLTIKTFLAAKNAQHAYRITFGSLLPFNHCNVGACGKFQQPFDSWVISNEIRSDDELQVAGHAMVITGYDDNAVIVDNEGGKHKGALIIRNSWSNKVGDAGNFYMSYDFFKQFVTEVELVANTLEEA